MPDERAILREALNRRSPSERAAYLDIACEGQAGLRKRVDQLLRETLAADGTASGDVAVVRPRREAGPLPETFGRYQVLRLLGQGAMGSVYLARDTVIGRDVALKIPKFGDADAADVVERFRREARTAGGLHHQNICPVYDVGEEGGTHFLTMHYVEGKPLSRFIGPDKLQTPRAAAVIVRKLASALGAAHAAGVIHRDLKPANVMIDARGEPVVMDFGLARPVHGPSDVRLTQSGAMVGTPAYMSPEQILGDPLQVGPHTDIWALGVILFELLAGRLPYDGGTLQVIGSILSADPPPVSRFRPDVPSHIEQVCARMLARDVSRRYATMADVAADLSAFLKEAAGGRSSGPVSAVLQATHSATPAAGSPVAQAEAEELPMPVLTSVPRARARTRRAGGSSPRGRTLLTWGVAGGAAAALLVVLVAVIATRERLKPGRRVRDEPRAEVSVRGAADAAPDSGPSALVAGSPRAGAGGTVDEPIPSGALPEPGGVQGTPPDIEGPGPSGAGGNAEAGVVLAEMSADGPAETADLVPAPAGGEGDAAPAVDADPDRGRLLLPAGPFGPGTTVDLLPYVDVKRDSVPECRRDAGELECPADKEWFCRAPVIPQGSYEVSAEFTRLEGDATFGLDLPVGGRQVLLMVGSGRNRLQAGIGAIRGKALDTPNETTVDGPALVNGRRYRLRASVQLAGKVVHVMAWLDQTKVTDWRGPADVLQSLPAAPLPMLRSVGLYSYFSRYRVHALGLTMRDGTANPVFRRRAATKPERAAAGVPPPVKSLTDRAVTFGGHQYELLGEPLTWHEARDACEALGGHLVTVDSPGENEFLLSICDERLPLFWAGATDEHEDGDWTWVDGRPMDLPGVALDNYRGRESHLGYYPPGRGWNDLDGSQSFPCLCEWDDVPESRFVYEPAAGIPEDDAGWESLLSGEADLLEGDRRFWTFDAERKCLVVRVPKGSKDVAALSSPRDYGDFELEAEVRLPKAYGRAGIEYRVGRWGTGVEGYTCELGWGSWSLLADERRTGDARSGGGIYPWFLSPYGWNRVRIRAEGPEIRHWLNDVRTVVYRESDRRMPRKGRVLLKADVFDGEAVEYRNLRVRRLGTGNKAGK